MMQLVPVEDVYVQALQVKHPIIDWKVHTEGQRSYRQYSELLAKFQAQEEEIVRLMERVKVLEDKEDVATTQSRDDAPIKGRSINEGEASAERISNDSKEIARVLTSIDAATILAGGIDVPTGSGFIPTAGPPATVISIGNEVGPTASLIVTRRKGKEVMVESDTPKKKKLQEQIDAQVASKLEEQQEKENMRMNEQIARDAEVARIHAEEELQGMIDSLDKSNETIAKYLQEYQDFALELPLRRPMTKKQKREYYMAVIRSNLGWRVKDFKGMTFEEIEAKFAEVWKYVENFIPIGSKEETKRLKRKGLNLEQEQVKKQKSSEEAAEIETSTEEFTEEKMKEMMQLVPVEDVYVQALQVKHPIIDWKKLYDLSGVHHLTAKDKEIFMLVEKDYPLRKGLALVMISYKLQVENYSQMAEDLIRKIYDIANSPRQQGVDNGRFHEVPRNSYNKDIVVGDSMNHMDKKQYSRRARIAQSSALPTVADDPASPVRHVSKGEACPTESGFIADQDRATIAKSSTLPHDSAPRVTSPTADEGNMQHNISKLTALCTSLQRQYSELLVKFQAQKEEIVRLKERVQVLEDKEGIPATQSGDDAPIKGRSINEGEAAAERISNDSEEVARVLTSIDAATVIAGGIDVPTGSGLIPSAGPPATIISTGSEVGPTASPIVTRRKGKEVMVESDTPKKKKLQEQIDAQVARELELQQEKENMRMNEQIARDVEVARIDTEEELQAMINSLDKSNETIAKYLQEYQDFALELPLEKRIELISDLVKYQDNYSKVYKFQSQQRRLMTKKQKREYYIAVIKSNLGWRLKDFKGMTFEEIEAKFAEVWKHVENFIPMGSKEETKKLKRKDLLKQLDREDLNPLWDLVKEYLSIRPGICDKEMELWVELKRMYEPDPEDQLWTLTQNFIHAPVEWKLYDLKKDYPLRKGLALVMISYKLQVENYSQMAEDLIRKIYNIANTPRRSIKFRGGLLGIKCTRHSHCQVKSSHWQYKFPLPVKVVATAKRLEMPLPEVCTAIEKKKKKLLVKDRWQLH
nr:hypothetical protein [Tanacetum cinerariifolium]